MENRISMRSDEVARLGRAAASRFTPRFFKQQEKGKNRLHATMVGRISSTRPNIHSTTGEKNHCSSLTPSLSSQPDLAAQVPTLTIFDRCRCRDDIGCGTFYTKPKPKGGFGPGHRNMRLFPHDGALLILDVVAGNLVAVVLDRPDVREKLDAALP